ncbi:MAG: Mut7-C RNAse domain-containing protein, partial [Gammaproteobacteria bacterium]
QVDLVLVDGHPRGLGYVLAGDERVSAYPVFEAFDVAAVTELPGRPLRRPRFFADEHLARLARYLRLAGFDTALAPGLQDNEVVRRARNGRRILLTRDRELVSRYRPERVLRLHSQRPAEQLAEVVRCLQLERTARPFSRCLVCNHPLRPASRAEVAAGAPARVARDTEAFLACSGCGRIYWPGSHHRRMQRILERAGLPTA